MKITLRILWHRLTYSWPRRFLEWSGRREYVAGYEWWDSGVQFHASDSIKAWSFKRACEIAKSRCPASKPAHMRDLMPWEVSTFSVVRADQLVG